MPKHISVIPKSNSLQNSSHTNADMNNTDPS